MLTKVDADTTQLFAGAKLTQDDQCKCTACNRTLREGEQVTIYAACKEDDPTFRIERLYCRECTPEDLTSPTLGLNEYLLGGHIARTLDVRIQRQFQTLHDPQTLATSVPSEGTAEAHDEHADPSALILATKTQKQDQELTDAIYHIESTDETDTDTEEEPTPLCNCSLDEEYTRISLAEAEASAARCCRNCRTAREGGQDTRSCLYCEEQIAVSRWPQHVRACTSDPTDAATETDPDGDPVITDSATATYGTAPPATHRSVPVGAEGSESTQE